MTTKQQILEELHNGVITVSFTKVNGERRDMQCTLNEALLPERPETVETADIKPVRKENPTVQSVWDVDAKGWRSFRWENVIEGNV
jgi:hypothetical protein